MIRDQRGRQDLDRDLPLQLGIGGPIDFTHAPAPDEIDQLEDADAGLGVSAKSLKCKGETGRERIRPA